MTTPTDTALLRRLLASATPGPWGLVPPSGEIAYSGDVYWPAGLVFDDGSAGGEYDQKCSEADRDAIIAIRNAAPEMLRELDDARAMNAMRSAASTHLLNECDQLREALETVLNSARPNPTEHPTMSAAWATARAVLESTRETP